MSDDINEIHFFCDFVSLFLFCLHQKKKKEIPNFPNDPSQYFEKL